MVAHLRATRPSLIVSILHLEQVSSVGLARRLEA
jgi:hypothetical protein